MTGKDKICPKLVSIDWRWKMDTSILMWEETSLVLLL